MAEPTIPPRARREGLWLWGLAALVLLALVIVFAVRACDGDDGTGSSGTPAATDTGFATVPSTAPGITESTSQPDPAETVPPANGGGKGSLLVGATNLYPALGEKLTPFANQQVTGKGIKVVSVVGDESFWAGQSKARRLLVVINLKGESPPKVRAGQTVDFVGQLLQSEAGYGVTEAEGKTLLERQGHHAFVSVGDLKLR